MPAAPAPQPPADPLPLRPGVAAEVLDAPEVRADLELLRTRGGTALARVQARIRLTGLGVLAEEEPAEPAPAPPAAPPPDDGYTQGTPRERAGAFDPASVEKALGFHNPASEAYTLAAAVQCPAVRSELLGNLTPADFHVLPHKVVFEQMLRLDADGPFDAELLAASFAGTDLLRLTEGGELLRKLAERSVDPAVAVRHAETVRRLGERRRLTAALRSALWDVAEGRVDPNRALDAIAGLAGPQSVDDGDDSGWPAPPGDAVWHGPAGALVKAVEPFTEADPLAVLVQVLVIFGNLIGRTAHWAVGGRRHYCNLFAAVVGPTSTARKGTAFDVAEQLLKGFDEDWEENFPRRGMCSGEGFILAVKDPDVKDKRALWFEPEFGSTAGVIARDGNNLSGKVREAFDSGNLASASKADPVRTTNAHISIVGHTTFRELRENLSEREYSNGFVNRFMWVCSRMSKVLCSGGDLGLLDLASFRRDFGRAHAFACTPSVSNQAMPLDTESQALWATLYPELIRPRPGRIATVTARSYVIVRRLAVIYAVLDRSRQVRRPHLDAAAELWKYCFRSARLIFAEGKLDAETQRVYSLIEEAMPAGLSRYDLRRKAYGGRDDDRLGRVLDDLSRQGLVIRETQKRPRAVEVWKLLG